MAPISGDADEVSGTGVSGTFGGAAKGFSGAWTAHAHTYGAIFRHAFRGADGDKHHRRQKQRSFDRIMARRRAKEREQAAEAARLRAEAIAEAERMAAEAMLLQASLEQTAAELVQAHLARLAREDEEAALLILLAA